MAVTVYKSSDTNAPPLNGVSGKLDDVLKACLVTGYGSVFASGTVTSSGVNVSNGDTVTVGSKTYTFRTSLTVGVANEVLIGANAAASLANLQSAINLFATSGTTWTAVTLGNTDIWASAVTATVLTLTARVGGTGGNSLALSRSAATLTVSGANLTGGSGTDTIAAAGWSKPYTGNPGQAVYKGGSGVQHFYHLDDSIPNTTALGKEAQFRGSETASAFQTVTGYFPTVAQFALAAGLVIRKSAAIDTTARSWIVVADDRTVYVYASTGDTAGSYMTATFGEFYSIYSGTDLYRSQVTGRITANSSSFADDRLPFMTGTGTTAAVTGHYVPRSYTAVGGSIQFGAFTDVARMGGGGAAGAAVIGGGGLAVPNAPDGSLHIAPIHLIETASIVRGRYRGLFSLCHPPTSFADGDTITGSGAYAGRTFLVIKSIATGAGPTLGMACMDITGPWETN